MHANISISQMPALSLFQPGCPFRPYGASDAELAPYNFDVAAMDAAALQSQSAQLATALVGGGAEGWCQSMLLTLPLCGSLG